MIRVKPAKLAFILLFLAVTGFFMGGCSPAENYTKTEFLMDTKVDLVLYDLPDKQADHVAGEIFSEMKRMESVLDKHTPGSDVYRINAAAGRAPVKVQPETMVVMQKALEIAALSGGAFDPTVGPLLELWGWDAGAPRVPEDWEIEAVLPFVDYKLVEVDVGNSTIFLPSPDMKIDLGGIAKGFIVDRGQTLAKKLTSGASYINAGGDINIIGRKPSGEKWRIAIQDPQNPQEWAAIVPLKEGSVATSGDYQRFFEEAGETYHHLLDPQTGMPAGGDVRSVTVVAPEAMTADALATAVFVLGRESGLQLLENLENTAGAVIDPEGKVHVSSGLAAEIEILSSPKSAYSEGGSSYVASTCWCKLELQRNEAVFSKNNTATGKQSSKLGVGVGRTRGVTISAGGNFHVSSSG
ncbi:MAG: FAD:protein FMN transferase [Dethiobacteria bacterium]|jgi:thiamine biosynthesis lipoprotein